MATQAGGSKGSPRFWEPQFVLGMIILLGWIISVGFTLTSLPTYTTNSNLLNPLDSLQTVSALFTTALGFVLGHYFGKEVGKETAKAAEGKADVARNTAVESATQYDETIASLRLDKDLLNKRNQELEEHLITLAGKK